MIPEWALDDYLDWIDEELKENSDGNKRTD